MKLNQSVTWDYVDDLGRLPRAVKLKARRAADRLAENPRAPELHVEKVKGSDLSMFSCRVDPSYRIIWMYVNTGDQLLCLVDKHDEAYRRACRRSSAVEDRGLKVAHVPEKGATPVNAERRLSQSLSKRTLGALFIAYSDQDLQSMGVGAAVLPMIRQLDDANQLDAVEDQVDAATYDRLLAVVLYRDEERLKALGKAWKRGRGKEQGACYGHQLALAGRLSEAEATLREVVARFPGTQTLVDLARVLSRQHDDEQVVELLREVITKCPEIHREQRFQAEVYLAVAKQEQALAEADEELRINPRSYRNWHAIAEALFDAERPDELLEAAERGLELIAEGDAEARPVLYDLVEYKVIALDELGQTEKALEGLDELCRLFPEKSDPLEDKAEWLLELQRYEEALRVLDKAEAAGYPFAFLRYKALHALGRPEEALEVIRPDLTSSPDLLRSRLEFLDQQVGWELYWAGETAAARNVFDQLCMYAPDAPSFLSDLGYVLVGDGVSDEAERILVRVEEMQGSQTSRLMALLALAYLYLQNGALAAAERALQKAESMVKAAGDKEGMTCMARIAYWKDGRILPDYADHPKTQCAASLSLPANRVALLLARGETAGAEKLARAIAEAAPELSLGYRVLGWALVALGRFEEARACWEQGLERAQDLQEQAALQEWIARSAS